MRAALGRSSKDRSTTGKLLALTGQLSILETSLRSVMRAARTHFGSGGGEASLAGRVRRPQTVRLTRSVEQGLLPPQESSSTLISSMAAVWNVMPRDIKEEEQEAKWKKKIKTFCAKNAHFCLRPDSEAVAKGLGRPI
jgi:hypothetical protein